VKHQARKRFGQHFLTDQGVIAEIVDAIAPEAGQQMVEIGPGLAAITQPLVERVGHLQVIELDRDLAARLRQHKHLTVHEANLPYNISTPILFHLLDHVAVIQDQHFMLQKEVVERMVAAPASAAYGRLSVMLQWRYAMEMVVAVGPMAFEPPPRVDSAVVRMTPHPQPAPLPLPLLSELVQVAFSQRRKLLRHTLGRWLQERGVAADFDVQRRAEEVAVAEYVLLAQQVSASRP